MESEAGISSPPPSVIKEELIKKLIIGVSKFWCSLWRLTSPLYVYTSTFVGRLQDHQNEEAIFGAFSLIFWTLTLIPLAKYVLIVLSADDSGEGGTFALYSLLCRHVKFSLLPNRQPADEELSAYGPSTQLAVSSRLKKFLEKHERYRTALLIVVLCGACMVIGDGILTPAISVLSSVSGLATQVKLTEAEVNLIACGILVGLFALQRFGTHWVAFLFAPIVIIWLMSLFAIGLYNTVYWNPKIVVAMSPHYIIRFFRETGRDGWIALAGILLSITGTEAMFANLGHFTALSIRLAFAFVVYPCLVVQYMGQAAFLSKNLSSIPTSFYDSVPKTLFWPVFGIATLAAIVGSQAVITATFSIIKQCNALGCFPRVKIVHTSRHMFGQIYIPEINWILMILCLAVTVGFRDTTSIGIAYGIACITVMFISTWLMALVIVFVWQKNIPTAAAFLLLFGSIEGIYLSSSVTTVPHGGWLPLVLALIFMGIMYTWHYGTREKYNFDLHNKASLKWLLTLSPSLGIARVPGIGLIYSELTTGIPAVFSHFVTNFPAFHKVLVFVCVKSVPVPYVSPEERFLIGRLGPKSYRVYRCIVRYGYKDIQRDDSDFENQIIHSIAEFIQMEAADVSQFSSSGSPSSGGRTAVISIRSVESLIVTEQLELEVNASIQSSESSTFQSLRSVYEEENPCIRRRVRLQLPQSSAMDSCVREELTDLIQAKEAGIVYIVGNTYVKARRSSSFLKKMVIDIGYSYLDKNCRGASVALNVPHLSLIEVGMIYYV
ncbi:potassium transporter 4-like [Papaver somniferum]|uniref:potassium transporter 4-like n=1 Tax=Papaver somniferum TaxID=3469 RepID=UPI000E6F66FF|nr:potassium transporter 4-like [Papaver somniferum]